MPSPSRILAAAFLSVPVLLAGCEQKAPPSAGQSNKPLGGLSESPQSILGKSAKMGKDVGTQIQGSQDQAVNMANEIAGGEGTVVVGGVKFTPPKTWASVQPPNRVQTAALRVASDEGKGETAVAFFANVGGDVASNISRWKGQVTAESGGPVDAKISETTASGMKLTIVSMEGTYNAMTMGATKAMPGFAFRGAIFESPTGNIFVRLTGPAAKVRESDDAFKAMLTGASRQ
ncbi:MAG: hypothetical protein K2Q20_09945 [Phycisphaerales bacterium]|nr:hypothetical protein [Phycisphaerales bacterium]